MPAYVRRDVTPEVERAFRSRGLVVIEGPAVSGKSRLAFEAIHALRPDHRLIAPRTGAEIRELTRSAQELTEAVVWLDSVEGNLSSGALDALARRVVPGSASSDVTLVATLDRALVGEVSWSGSAFSHGYDDPLADATVIRLPRELSHRERAVAQRHRGDARIAACLEQSLPGLAAQLVGGPEALRRWRSARTGEHRVGAAIVSAAVEARRSGYLQPMSRDLLRALHRQFLAEEELGSGREPGRHFEEGLAWACAPAAAGARGCLIPLGDDHYLPLAYLVDRSGTLDDAGQSETFWRTLLGHVAPEHARLLGVFAFPSDVSAGPMEMAISERAFRLAADAGDRLAMDHLGRLYEEVGRQDEAERWHRRAAANGYLLSWCDVGRLHAATGREPAPPDPTATGEREESRLVYYIGYKDEPWEFAVEIGYLLRYGTDDPETLYQVGSTLVNDAPEFGPVPWLRRAAEAGHTQAMYALGDHLEPEVVDQPDAWRESEHWFRCAAEAGHARAMYRLAGLLEKAGRDEDAVHWYQEAIKHGAPRSVRRLGELLVRTGRSRQAERLYRLALAHGHADIKQDLDRLLARAPAAASPPPSSPSSSHREPRRH